MLQIQILTTSNSYNFKFLEPHFFNFHFPEDEFFQSEVERTRKEVENENHIEKYFTLDKSLKDQSIDIQEDIEKEEEENETLDAVKKWQFPYNTSTCSATTISK